MTSTARLPRPFAVLAVGAGLGVASWLATPSAPAADPASGKVSRSAPTTAWKGKITSFQSWQAYNAGQGQCMPGSCDTYTLEVADGPAQLRLKTVTQDNMAGGIEVIAPDGSKQYFSGTDTVQATIRNPKDGKYTLNIVQNEATEANYDGSAEALYPSDPTPPSQPAPQGTPTGGSQQPPPAATPAPAQLKVTTRSASAKRASRKRRLALAVQSTAPVTRLSAVLAKGKRNLGRGALARLDGRGTVVLKLGRGFKKGTYTVRVQAVDAQGRTVSASGRLRVKR